MFIRLIDRDNTVQGRRGVVLTLNRYHNIVHCTVYRRYRERIGRRFAIIHSVRIACTCVAPSTIRINRKSTKVSCRVVLSYKRFFFYTIDIANTQCS